MLSLKKAAANAQVGRQGTGTYLVAVHAVEALERDELLEMVDGGEAGHPDVFARQLLQLGLVLRLQHQVHLLVKPGDINHRPYFQTFPRYAMTPKRESKRNESFDSRL